MPSMLYQEQRDRAALELYARYDTTPEGIRVISISHVYLFRRTPVLVAPVDPTLQPEL